MIVTQLHTQTMYRYVTGDISSIARFEVEDAVRRDELNKYKAMAIDNNYSDVYKGQTFNITCGIKAVDNT